MRGVVQLCLEGLLEAQGGAIGAIGPGMMSRVQLIRCRCIFVATYPFESL